MQEEKSEDQEYREALDDLNLNKEEVDDKALVSHNKEDDLSNKVTSIKDSTLEYQMNLEGKTYDPEKGGFVQTGKALVGTSFIKLSTGILNSYAQSSNLLTTKKTETFVWQFKDAHEKVNMSLSMRSREVPERVQRAILKMFKDTLWNVCEIIVGSEGNMERVFGGYRDKEEMKKDIYGEGGW